jgi:S-(hydroxymethyl)glutathione dehydrogenase/alcohol dehydrogenase
MFRLRDLLDRLDLGSMVSHRISLSEINDGIDLLRRADGVRTVIV